MTDKVKRDLAGWGAIGALTVLLLGASLTFYGRFSALEARMDRAEQDRTEMNAQLNRIEQTVGRIEGKLGK